MDVKLLPFLIFRIWTTQFSRQKRQTVDDGGAKTFIIWSFEVTPKQRFQLDNLEMFVKKAGFSSNRQRKNFDCGNEFLIRSRTLCWNTVSERKLLQTNLMWCRPQDFRNLKVLLKRKKLATWVPG